MFDTFKVHDIKLIDLNFDSDKITILGDHINVLWYNDVLNLYSAFKENNWYEVIPAFEFNLEFNKEAITKKQLNLLKTKSIRSVTLTNRQYKSLFLPIYWKDALSNGNQVNQHQKIYEYDGLIYIQIENS